MTAQDSPEVLARIEEGLPLVEIIARQLRRDAGALTPLDDLLSLGREALLHAAREYQADRGVPFRRWANLRVRGSMIDGIRRSGNVPRRVYKRLKVIEAADRVQEGLLEDVSQAPPTTPEAADQKLTEYLSRAAAAMAIGFIGMRSLDERAERVAEEEESPEDQTARAELLAILRAAIDERPEQERQLLMRHYFDDVTFEEAARELGLSKSWASRLHARAMEGLARRIKRERIE